LNTRLQEARALGIKTDLRH